MVAVFSMASVAEAAEGEAQIGIDTGMGASLSAPKATFSGDLNLWIGLNDWFWLSSSVGLLARTEPLQVGGQGLVGVSTALDVLSWMPWAQVMIGAAALDEEQVLYPVARVEIGVDRWINFDWAVGLWGRTQIGAPASWGGVHVLGGLRVLKRWEF